MIDEFGAADKIEGAEYCEALKTGSRIMTDPYRELKCRDEGRIKRRERQFKPFSFKSLPEGTADDPANDC